MHKQVIEISFSAMLKAALLVVGIWLFWRLSDLIAVILLSIVIASAIEPATEWFRRHGIPRILGVVCIYLISFVAIALAFYLILPPLISDIVSFLQDLPRNIEQFFQPESPLFLLFPGFPSALNSSLRDFALGLEKYFETIAGGIFSAGATLFGGVLSIILLVVISFYLSVQERGVENFLRIVTPIEYEPYIMDLWARSQRKMGRWLQGQLLLAALVGVMVFLGLTILGVEYASSLAILSAMFEIIPVFGPVMAALPAVAISFIQSPVLGISVLVFYIFVQQFENHLIYPLVVKKTVGVKPLLVVIALVIGGELGGLFGIILSVPIAVVLVEFLNDIDARKGHERTLHVKSDL